MKKKSAHLWVSLFGAGRFPIAPGTCGSAVIAALFAVVVLSWGIHAAFFTMLAMALMGAMSTLICGPAAIRDHGQDPSIIVSDEQCGQAITFLFLWPAQSAAGWLWLTLAGFLLFRLFDILKPPPVRQLEKVPGALGVLLDDVMAGIFANVILLLLVYCLF